MFLPTDLLKRVKRFKTREVMVGNVGVGGDNPIRIQSMTTSSTRDIEGTIDQIMRLADTGCEIIRVTVQGKKEALSCEGIKNGLLQKGYKIPLVADIHFYPPAALLVADFVDKVRINPGNYLDKRAIFETIEYDDASYEKEMEKIREGLSPLVEKCKRLKRAMRIGVNHGSLSDRIMSRYGDSPKGMVESAIEFAKVCRMYDYHDIIFSMKASNVLVMIEAYRLLVQRMGTLGWDYPLHLGVTEAGDGEDGRVKSAIGTGSLLLDGIGDTIRVSLTEDPWQEIDPCKRLIEMAKSSKEEGFVSFKGKNLDIFSKEKRAITFAKESFLHPDGTVILPVTNEEILRSDFYTKIGCDVAFNRPQRSEKTVDALLLLEPLSKEAKEKIQHLQKIGMGIVSNEKIEGALPLKTMQEAKGYKGSFALTVQEEDAIESIEGLNPALILLKLQKRPLMEGRAFASHLESIKSSTPLIFYPQYEEMESKTLLIKASAECGSLLADRLGQGLCLKALSLDLEMRTSLSFGILQGTRLRSVKTEFIACPGCGRTLFNLQEVTQRIRAKTDHLPGVKIAIMGCIVNGPGEMADADFGYVGSKPDKVDLYVGKKCIRKNIDFESADEELIALIKAHGRWKEPKESLIL